MTRRLLSPNEALFRSSFHRRNIVTSTDTTSLTSKPNSASEPLTLKPSEDSFQSYNWDLPSLEAHVTKDELLQIYREIQTMRRMEMPLIGQSQQAWNTESNPDDLVIATTTRLPSHMAVFAELLGRQAGIFHGKGGFVHIFTPSLFGGNGIGRDGMHVCDVWRWRKYPGTAFEAYNMAKLWNLPCIFVFENNKYGMGTPAERSSSKTGDYTHGPRNGHHLRQASRPASCNWAVDQGNGPLILEFVTYRYGGHSMSDPGTTYRTREEVQRMRSTQDPIRGLQKYLEEWGVASEQELKAIDKEAKDVADAAVEKSKSSPEPAVKGLWSDIYYKGTEREMMRRRDREEFHRY
ncbi:pyruvate dehydrogenase e1 component alpha subunit [Coprinopsis sp. MPI-PUGE-AT-0042]|nr:pyruvate dehydrogenase e1 component alpha subunit [Coprinopsis sp. MPI-PUGE-AT-0042]